jgi:hypothetical protein
MAAIDPKARRGALPEIRGGGVGRPINENENVQSKAATAGVG